MNEQPIHKSLVAALSKEQRRDLFRQSNLSGLVHLAGHLAVLIVGAVWIATQAPFWPLVPLPYSIALICLFMPLHESIHKTAFRSDWLNNLVAFFCGLVVVIPPTWFRCFHFEHHRFTNDPARDPELAEAKPASLKAYLWHLTGMALWLSLFRCLVGNAQGLRYDSFVPLDARKTVTLEARIFCLIYVLIAAGFFVGLGPEIFWLWLMPVLIGQPFLRAYLMAEHMLCPQVPDMLENSRTVTANPVLRFFTWNMPFHAEHHLLPGVPFHRLVALHELTRPYVRVLDKSYKDVHRQIRQSIR